MLKFYYLHDFQGYLNLWIQNRDKDNVLFFNGFRFAFVDVSHLNKSKSNLSEIRINKKLSIKKLKNEEFDDFYILFNDLTFMWIGFQPNTNEEDIIQNMIYYSGKKNGTNHLGVPIFDIMKKNLNDADDYELDIDIWL